MKDPIYQPAGRAREYSPLALNLYRGCSHGCTYCYAPSATFTRRQTFHLETGPRPGIREALTEQCRGMRGDPREILLSFTSDPYQPGASITRHTLNILARFDMNVQILTKGGLRAAEDFPLLRDRKWKFGSTISFWNESARKEYEPNAAPIPERIEAVKTAHAMGILTWISLEPVIDTIQALHVIEALYDHVDLWKLGAWNYDERAKQNDWRTYLHRALGLLAGKQIVIKRDLLERAGIPYVESHQNPKSGS
jgi:DNA repair photolyase